MSRHLCRVPLKTIILAVWLGIALSAEAQTVRDLNPNRVVSITEDAAGSSVHIATAHPQPLPPPTVQYLPGDDGETIMVADFHNVEWGNASRVFVPQSPTIKQVRVGQIQASPPICRVSITATGMSELRRLSFRATPGSLTIRWTEGSAHGQAPRRLYPAPAHTAHTPPQAAPAHVAQAPPAAPPIPMSHQPPAPKAAPAHVAQMPPAAPPLPALRPELPVPVAASHPTGGDAAGAPPQAKAVKAPPPAREPALKVTDRPASREWASLKAASAVEAQRKPERQPEKAPEPAAASARAPAQSLEKVPDKAPDLAAARAATVPKAAPPRPGAVESALSALSVAVPEKTPDASPKAEPAISREPAAGPQLRVSAGQPLRIELSHDRPISFRSFRLHDPERYVLDLQSLPELAERQPVTPESNPHVEALRFGHPEGDEGTSRIVLDLKTPEVEIKEELASSQLALTLTVGQAMTARDLGVPPGATVVIDAGHGGSDPGAQRGEIQEKELTLQIADKLRKILDKGGARVVMTRSDDTYVSLEDRVNITNNVKPDVFVSIHINSLETNSTIRGIETYYQNGVSKDLAATVHEALVNKLSAPDRSVRKARFYVINHTPVPAILAEVGFISNLDERAKLISSDYQNDVADGLARGVILYLAKRPDLAQSQRQEGKAVAVKPAGGDARQPGPTQSLAEAAGSERSTK